jgi:ubiquinone/menaquinone biosynthesis C-methylase UbiE
MLWRAQAKRSGRVFLVQGSAVMLPLRSESVAAVVSTFSMHWWPSIASGLAEMFRVLRPRGLFLAAVVASRAFALPVLGQLAQRFARPLIHLAPPSDYAALVERAGFVDVRALPLSPFGYLLEARRE